MGIGSRPAACASCDKRLSRKSWYYRNGHYFCTKRCWVTGREKLAKAAEEQAASAKAAKEPVAETPDAKPQEAAKPDAPKPQPKPAASASDAEGATGAPKSSPSKEAPASP